MLGALIAIGGAAPGPDPPLPPPLPPHGASATDGLLARVEEALAEEIARARISGIPAAGLRPLHGRLLEVRVARERLRLAEAVERSQPRRFQQSRAGDPVGATMEPWDRRPFAPLLRFPSPGLLGVLVNVVA